MGCKLVGNCVLAGVVAYLLSSIEQSCSGNEEVLNICADALIYSKTEAFRPTATPRKGQTVLQHEMESSAPSETPSKLSIANETTSPSQPTSKGESGRGGKGKGKSTGERREKAPRAQKQALKQNASGSGGAKLRGLEKDSPEVRLSKTFSWLLRHGAQGEGLPMRKDGYVKVTDLVCGGI